ncbi:MarR family transcriptional regulator [Sphingomonas sp.]|uniref:MarR family transcriptional regulator n=1 Tax=Sphingomonas sp. TaxID=28214 RepID=UPI002DD669B1|nr:MarR family transcriptional regulator [Sphingomonas sp.]
MTEGDMPFEFVRECVLLGRRWRARVDERLKPTGMTLARFTVLYWVDELPAGFTQRDLADVVGIEGPTLVRLLHALEDLALIERVAVATDRRAKTIRPTAAAAPLLRELTRVCAELSQERLSGLEKRRLPSATRLVREARAALE